MLPLLRPVPALTPYALLTIVHLTAIALGAGDVVAALLATRIPKNRLGPHEDTVRNTLKTNHRDFDKPLIVEKTQENEDGLLVWGEMPLGPATKNLLVHFGKEKWAMHFWGYDDKRKDSCI